MEKYGDNGLGKQSKIFVWKPCFSVRFRDGDPASAEFSDVDGEKHRYPRIQAHRVLLVGIGIGLPLH